MTTSPAPSARLDLAPSKAWRRFLPSWLRSLVWLDSATHYDAFLSYSWKADSEIAPVIQSVVQRFLCPWYRLRAKTVFRDLSCLPAGSSLEAQLFDRIDRSDHLILLASPEASDSHGMEIEARHWFSQDRQGQILIIVTSGDCKSWEDIRHELLPSSVRNNLPSEPLWIPLQQRRGDMLANPTSHIVRGQLIEDLRQILLCLYPGRDWGQLRGEERSQRRRALGLISVLMVVFLMLAIAALGFAWYAHQQQLLAQSRQLAAQSAQLQSQSPALLPRSILLAIESLRINQNLEADQAIRTGVPLLDKPAFTIPYQGQLNVMTLSPTGEFLATAGYLEKRVDLWKVSDRKRVTSFPFDDPVEEVAFSPDGRYLFVVGLGSSVLVVWDLPTTKEVGHLECRSEVHALTFSHNGKYLATGHKDHRVRLWRLSMGDKIVARQVAVLDHQDEVFGVTFSKDDRYLATSFLNIVAVWKLSADINAKLLGYVEADAAVNSIAISPDNKYLATGICCGRPFRLWGLTSLALVAIMPDEGPASIAFSPDAKYVAAASKDKTAGVWEVETQRQVSRIEDQSDSVAFSPDGKHLVTRAEHGITFWEWNNDPITSSFPGTIGEFASSADGRSIILTWPTEKVESFDVDTQLPIFQMKLDEGESAMALSGDGTRIATRRGDGDVLVRDVARGTNVIATMKSTQSKPNADEGVRSARFSSDGNRLVVKKNDGTLLFWDLKTGEIIRGALQDPKMYSMRFSKDGYHLITASGLARGSRAALEKHIVRVWEVATGRPTVTVEVPWPVGAKKLDVHITITEDGRYFATAAENTVQVWDSSTGRELAHMAHEGTIHDLTFSPNGKFLGTASVDRTARLWDVKTGKEITRMPHEDAVWQIAFNPDGKHLGTASDDRTARIWEYPEAREIARAEHSEGARGIFFSGDGSRVISWSPTSGDFKSWLWRSKDLEDAACHRLSRNLTQTEWHEYLSGSPRKTCSNLP